MSDYFYLKGLEARIEKLESAMTQKTNNDDFDFSVGQTVYFFHTEYVRNGWGENDTIVYPTELKLLHGRIFAIYLRADYVLIEVEGYSKHLAISYKYFHEWVFKSKEDALQAMFKKLHEIGANND